MYIGSTGPEGLFHLLREVADNSFDEAMAGHATIITVKLQPDDYVEVSDDGRGIPVEKHSKYKVSALELDRKSTRLNSSHTDISRMPSSA